MTDRPISTATASILRLALVAVLIGGSSWLTITLTRPAGGVTAIWLAGGLLVGILMSSPRSRWPATILVALCAEIAARWLVGGSAIGVVLVGSASTLEACIVAFTLRWLVGDVTQASTLAAATRVALLSTIAAAATSALVPATLGMLRLGRPFWPTYIAWFVSHGLGMTIVATLFVVARAQGRLLLGQPGKRWRFARSLGLLAAVTLWVFGQSSYPLLFAIYPPLLFVVFRHRFVGAVVGVTLVMLISLTLTLHGSGPLYLVADGSLAHRMLFLQLFIATSCLLAMPVAVVLMERSRLARELRTSEQSYRLLADYSRDLVVRLRADGQRVYVSPSSRDVLGWEPAELMQPRWELVHPDDREHLQQSMQQLFATGVAMTVAYRALHRLGHYVWIEAMARRVPGVTPEDPAEIIYSGRDISRRVEAEHALADNQRRLRAIADNLPALVTHIDTEQRYTFVNAFAGRIFDIDPARMIGRTVQEVRSPAVYREILPHVQAALRGELVTFFGDSDINGRHYHFQSNLIPDRGADGVLRGFYAMTFDISDLKQAELELKRIAEHDSLTGLGNRNKFNHQLALVLAREPQRARPLALIYLDIDHFKQINDQRGHAVGDAVLGEFAARLADTVRPGDLAIRLGGDEFAVLLGEIGSSEQAVAIAAQLVRAMQVPFVVDGAAFVVGASLGIAVGPAQAGAQKLMLAADRALYQAKANGRNTYCLSEVDLATAVAD